MKAENLLRAFGEIEHRFIDEAEEFQWKKHRINNRWGVVAACFIMFTFIGIFRVISLPEDKISINIIKNQYSMGSPKFYNPEYHNREEWNQDRLEEYFKKDYTELKMPNNLQFISTESEFIINNKSNSIVKDTTYIKYENQNEQSVLIGISRIENLSVIFYEYEGDSNILSKINDVDVMISGREEEDKKVYKELVGEFNTRGNIIRVEGNNLRVEEFHDILEEIIK